MSRDLRFRRLRNWRNRLNTSRLIEYATDRRRPDVAVQRADSLRRAVA